MAKEQLAGKRGKGGLVLQEHLLQILNTTLRGSDISAFSISVVPLVSSPADNKQRGRECIQHVISLVTFYVPAI